MDSLVSDTSPAADPSHLAVIPCRWGSTRFPGKPLALLGGKPLFWHVHQRCLMARSIVGAVVATDDHRIADACQEFAIPHVLTGSHETGTDRVAECARHIAADGYINVQGDEPFIDPEAIDAVSRALARCPEDIAVVNACARIRDAAEVENTNVVKAVQTIDGRILMFSRYPIPHSRGNHPSHLRQLGLYGMTAHALQAFSSLQQGPLERAESVEMLRLLEHGYSIKVVLTRHAGPAVDTPNDLVAAQQLLDSAAQRVG
ncbi:3-deoxy-manno-octulosonate cytidylyltransferase [Micromonospora sp. NPDC085948]|uniref:3-deoxy-manno-octulosonate cytidylyltransferase n=1 Tax=Micromonospora sp. NPDC085948 TaxID=3155293 RepID=UPI00344535C8